MNIENKGKLPIQQVGHLLKEIGSPARIKIILAIGNNEVCVCHLEANLGMRQAYLSQHLMSLRKSGVLLTNREGRFIHYRLANPKILDVIRITYHALNIPLDESNIQSRNKQCPCPKCQNIEQVSASFAQINLS
jgi:DNA-binding transcriptional ArsR family regulator